MRLRHASLIARLAALVVATPTSAAIIVLPPSADTWIGLGDKDDRSANHGSEPTLELGRFSIFSDRAILIMFDLSGIAKGETIESATLRLFEGPSPYAPVTDEFVVSLVTEPWEEDTVTGKDSPGTNDTGVMIDASTNPVFDVTALVDDWVNNGVPNHGIGIQNTGFTHGGNFNAREGKGKAPVLEIDLGGTICPADLNDDGVVDVADLVGLLAAWGPCAGCPADIDGNDTVDVADLVILLAAWGPCP
jgi:hypothetical protein